MWQMLKRLINAHWQTKVLVFMIALYMLAMLWTTLQAYARLNYSRSNIEDPIVIQMHDQS